MKQATIYTLIVTAALASLALGQGSVKPRISPVPLWPKDGNIPEERKGQNVFFSLETNEIVVSLEEPSGRKILRCELRNQAEAIINSQVSKQQDGTFVYDYTVTTGGNSRRPLKTWSLLLPADDPRFDIKSSAAWRVEKRATQLVDKQAARHAPLMYVDHSIPVGAGLSKGMGASGIRLVSSYLPGYVSSFARNDAQTVLSDEQLATLPKAVADEVRRAVAPEWDSQVSLSLGPRFAADTPKLMIAESFHYAISSFSMHGSLDKKSDFVISAIQFLRFYLQKGRSDLITSDQLSFLSAAKTPLEREIAAAMRLSLLVNP